MGRGAPEITHLFFAEDSLLFLRADKPQAERMKEILEGYEKMAGQKINFHKSAILFGKRSPEGMKDEICSQLSMKRCREQGKYLGLPFLIGR